MKADLYNHERRWKEWKELHEHENIDGLTKTTSDLVKQYLLDMENGQNVSTKSKRGPRSLSRLNKIAYTLTWVCRKLREHYKITDIRKAKAEQVLGLFKKMREGELRTLRGERFKSTSDYVKVTKAFWNWWLKVNRKKGIFLENITEDLDAKSDEKPKWVYLNEDQMDKFLLECNAYYKPLIAFLYDSGARPTETFSLLVEDLSKNAKGEVFINISDEISKGGKCGRKIKLLLCGKELLKYVKDKKLKPTDRLFSQSNRVTNRYISELSRELFGDKNSEAGKNYKNLSLVDLRHNSCCYWLPRYKTNANLQYRFGWKTEKHIHYYSEFLGLKDTINEEDLFVDITKTELEKELNKQQKEMEKLKEALMYMASRKYGGIAKEEVVRSKASIIKDEMIGEEIGEILNRK